MQADEELLKLSVGDLPGVGWQTQKKLEALSLSTVADVRNSRRDVLQRELGAKTGTMASHLPSSYLAIWLPSCMHVAYLQPTRTQAGSHSPRHGDVSA